MNRFKSSLMSRQGSGIMLYGSGSGYRSSENDLTKSGMYNRNHGISYENSAEKGNDMRMNDVHYVHAK